MMTPATKDKLCWWAGAIILVLLVVAMLCYMPGCTLEAHFHYHGPEAPPEQVEVFENVLEMTDGQTLEDAG